MGIGIMRDMDKDKDRDKDEGHGPTGPKGAWAQRARGLGLTGPWPGGPGPKGACTPKGHMARGAWGPWGLVLPSAVAQGVPGE